jgi:hypothetical protein
MKIFFCILLFLFCADSIQSQAVREKGVYIVPQAGALIGDQHISGQGTIIGGIEHKGWGLGIGAGIDWYKIRTVPVLIDIRRSIPVGKRPFFAYINAGWNLAAPRDKEYFRDENPHIKDDRFTNGVYGEAGLGYAFLNKAKKGILLSIGFTRKTVTERFTETDYIPTTPFTAYETERRLDYSFNRFIFKLGYKF